MPYARIIFVCALVSHELSAVMVGEAGSFQIATGDWVKRNPPRMVHGGRYRNTRGLCLINDY